MIITRNYVITLCHWASVSMKSNPAGSPGVCSACGMLGAHSPRPCLQRKRPLQASNALVNPYLTLNCTASDETGFRALVEWLTDPIEWKQQHFRRFTVPDETILLVDDEEADRGLMHDILRRQGYEVLEAMDYSSAWIVFKKHRERITLLVTD